MSSNYTKTSDEALTIDEFALAHPSVMVRKELCMRSLELARNLLAVQRRQITTPPKPVDTGLTRFVN